MHTLLHWGTEEQKQKYLKPLCDGVIASCFAMTEPEVAGSDPTLIKTWGYPDGDEWVISGHKWFISDAHRARFAILIARTEQEPDIPQAANTAFIVDLPAEGWTEVREIETMHGPDGHSEIRIDRSARAQRPDARRPRPRSPARPVPARPGPARALHALDRAGGDGARHDGRPFAQPFLARLVARREAGHPVDDRGVDDRALPVQADGAAHGVQDRSQGRLQQRSVDDEALRRERAQPHHRPRDPGARRARLLERHAARRHVPARPVGALRRRRRRDPPDAHGRSVRSPRTATLAAPRRQPAISPSECE